jgi:hypothetical protein
VCVCCVWSVVVVAVFLNVCEGGVGRGGGGSIQNGKLNSKCTVERECNLQV